MLGIRTILTTEDQLPGNLGMAEFTVRTFASPGSKSIQLCWDPEPTRGFSLAFRGPLPSDTWLGRVSFKMGDRRDSNPQQPESQSGALPLSYDHHLASAKNLLEQAAERGCHFATPSRGMQPLNLPLPSARHGLRAGGEGVSSISCSYRRASSMRTLHEDDYRP